MKRLFLIALVALGLTSCSKEHEFIGTWEAPQEVPGIVTTLQFTFNKDNSATLCTKVNNLNPTCIDGTFNVPEKDKLTAHFGDIQRYTFHPSKKNLFCEELQLTFKPAK